MKEKKNRVEKTNTEGTFKKAKWKIMMRKLGQHSRLTFLNVSKAQRFSL